MTGTDLLVGWARRHWFLVLAPLLVAVELAFARGVAWSADPFAEYAILFDLCLFVPALYALCYRRQLATGALVVRTAALFLGGVYLASLLVPPDAQVLLKSLDFLRPAGIAVLALIELKILIEIVRLAFGGTTSAQEISRRSGAPQWVARLMLIEARFWKAVWRLLRGR